MESQVLCNPSLRVCTVAENLGEVCLFLSLCGQNPCSSLHPFLFYFYFFLLGIFLIYIFNAIPKVPHTSTPPHSLTHPQPLFGPGVPLYWGI